MSSTVLHETVPAVLANVHPLDRACAGLFQPPPKASSQLAPAVPCPVPTTAPTTRHSSATNVVIDGKDVYDKSPLAAVSGTAIALNSSLEPLSWAIYEVSGVAVPNTITQIQVQAAPYTPAGSEPGFYVGLANYALGHWELAGRTSGVTWSGTVAATEPYRAPGGRVFIYVLAHGGQALSINRLTVTLDNEGWYETQVDATGNTGWFPAVAVMPNGNPAVVYASQADGRPRIAIGDRSAGLADPAHWAIDLIDPMLDAQVAGTSAAWLDVVIGPSGLPRVALSYLGVTGKGANRNSIACFSVLTQDTTPSGPELNWLNYRFGDSATGEDYLDGAGFSSIDYDPINGLYGTATYLRNANSTPAEPEYDMLLRIVTFDELHPRNGNLTSDTLRRFALFYPYWLYPHMRFKPDTGKIFVCGNGAAVYQQVGSLTEWEQEYLDLDSTGWGSLAFDPTSSRAGLGYCHTLPEGGWPPTRFEMTYVDEVTNPSSLPVPVDGVDVTAAQEAMALCSQLAYTPDGTPCLAYTSFDGTATAIRFATLEGADWVTEELPFTPSTPSNKDTQVLLDLAVDSLGVPVIAYTYLVGSDAELHVAVKSF